MSNWWESVAIGYSVGNLFVHGTNGKASEH